MKYRVKLEYGIYYPQVRSFLGLRGWHSTEYPEVGCHTLEDAIKEIEEHKRVFTKKKENIVWRSY